MPDAIFSFSVNYDGPWTSLDKLNLCAEALDDGGIGYDTMISVAEVPGDYVLTNVDVPVDQLQEGNYVDYFFNNIHVTALIPEEQDDSNGY